MPAPVFTGNDDPIVRVINGPILATLLPDARLVVIEGGGHLLLFDQTAQSAELVDGFLTSG